MNCSQKSSGISSKQTRNSSQHSPRMFSTIVRCVRIFFPKFHQRHMSTLCRIFPVMTPRSSSKDFFKISFIDFCKDFSKVLIMGFLYPIPSDISKEIFTMVLPEKNLRRFFPISVKILPVFFSWIPLTDLNIFQLLSKDCNDLQSHRNSSKDSLNDYFQISTRNPTKDFS